MFFLAWFWIAVVLPVIIATVITTGIGNDPVIFTFTLAFLFGSIALIIKYVENAR